MYLKGVNSPLISLDLSTYNYSYDSEMSEISHDVGYATPHNEIQRQPDKAIELDGKL